MKIVCPNCSSDYTVADDMLGPNGRKVKCASCQKIWHAVAEEEPAPAAQADTSFESAADTDVETDAAAGDVPKQKDLAVSKGSDELAGFAAAAANRFADGDVDFSGWDDSHFGLSGDQGALASGPVDGRGGRWKSRRFRMVRLKGEGPSVFQRVFSKALRFAPPVGVALGLLGLIWAIPARDAVVRAVPDLAPLYQMVGLDVNIRGIEFSPFTAERSMVAGLAVLRIEGTMMNADERARPVAPLRMALLAETGAELFVWRVDPPAEDLLPEQSVPIFSELTAPPETVASVSVRFLQEGERLPGEIN